MTGGGAGIDAKSGMAAFECARKDSAVSHR
jgi:hypothetical protein